jgi:ribosomal protein L16 Arg81 hydroxylase
MVEVEATEKKCNFYEINLFFQPATPKFTRGLNGLIQDIKNLMPREKLRVMFKEKLKTSTEFKPRFDKLTSTDFCKLVEFANNSKEPQSLPQKLRDHNIDVDKFLELVMFGDAHDVFYLSRSK